VKEANVIIARHRMIMNVLLFALFAVAVVIPPALADKREDAYAGVEHWSQAFNSGDVEQIVRMYTNDALVLGTLSPAMTSKPDDLRAYFKAAAAAKLQVKLGDHSAVALAEDAVGQDVPPRYRVDRVASRSVLPRERFSPLARSRHSRNTDAC
jgi:hypothetical protein